MASFNPHKIQNKHKRQAQHLKIKKQRESGKRDERFRRRRTEDRNPQLREARRAKNLPVTIDGKRTWDAVDADGDADALLGASVDVLNPKRRKVEVELPTEEAQSEDGGEGEEDGGYGEEAEEDWAERDSMLDSDSEGNGGDEKDDGDEANDSETQPEQSRDRPPSEAPSAATTNATDLDLHPESLINRFPTLFNPEPRDPKVLLTTSINSTLHYEAQLLTTLFPNASYIRRTAHFHSYKYSVREISAYAAARDYTCVVVLNEEQKKPKGLDIVHLPNGPMFHFTIGNWIEGKKLPGHGNPTNHFPELILNGFRTPLGLLTAHLFRSLFPPRPEIQGRQVVTLHNQRDYIFVRRHRYVFRDKRQTEKSIQGADGKPIKGVEEIRAGLQELGPRFTLKLRRVDKGIQWRSGQEWEWKAHDEKMRTRFGL